MKIVMSEEFRPLGPAKIRHEEVEKDLTRDFEAGDHCLINPAKGKFLIIDERDCKQSKPSTLSADHTGSFTVWRSENGRLIVSGPVKTSAECARFLGLSEYLAENLVVHIKEPPIVSSEEFSVYVPKVPKGDGITDDTEALRGHPTSFLVGSRAQKIII